MFSKRLINILVLCVCIAIPFLVLILHLATSPRFVSMSPDSGVFAYAGKLITEGKLPYRDFFDHKPPLVYYLNAIAIYLMGVTPWSIWWLDVIYLSITGIVLFLLLHKITGLFPAVLGAGIFIFTLMTPKFFLGGNLTETYGLLPQVLIVGAMYGYLKRKNLWWILLIGLLTSFASLFKQTTIALGIGALLTIIWLGVLSRQPARVLKYGLIFIAGFLLPWGLIALIWSGLGAFSQLWDAVIAYNFTYVKDGFSFYGFSLAYQTLLESFPFLPLTIIGFASFCVFVLGIKAKLLNFDRENKVDLNGNEAFAREIVFLAVFLAIPFEVLFITLSGRNYGHYFISLLPSIIFACSYLFSKLVGEIGVKSIGQVASMGFVGSLLLVWFIPAFISVHPQRQHLSSLRLIRDKSLAQDDITSYIMTHTLLDDYVLIWQVRPELNFITGRPAPSKYIYPLPLFVGNSGKQSRFDEFLQDLETNPPRLVILSENDSSIPAFDVSDEELCPNCSPRAVEGMRKLRTFVLSKYSVAAEFNGIRIYEKKK
jgi:hypothetical protein